MRSRVRNLVALGVWPILQPSQPRLVLTLGCGSPAASLLGAGHGERRPCGRPPHRRGLFVCVGVDLASLRFAVLDGGAFPLGAFRPFSGA
jgi:hypothetical protein